MTYPSRKIRRTTALIGAATLVIAAGIAIFLHSRTTANRLPAKTAPVTSDKGSIRTDYSAASRTLSLSNALSANPVPTSTWWVSALTGDWPERLDPFPFAVTFSSTGLLLGTPSIAASPDTVAATFNPDLSLSFPGHALAHSKVIAFSDDSVTLSLQESSDKEVAQVRLVKGSPFQYVTTDQPISLGMKSAASQDSSGTVRLRSTDSRSYAAYLKGTATAQANQTYLLKPSGTQTLSLAALPANASQSVLDLFDKHAASPVQSVESSIKNAGSTLGLAWKTADGSSSLFLELPHQQGISVTDGKQNLATYATIRGTAQLTEGSYLDVTYPDQAALKRLSLPKDDAFFQKSTLETYLKSDLASLTSTAQNGSYDAGKELFRRANLLDIAETAGSPTAPAYLDGLRSYLEDWLTYAPGKAGRYFAYDATLGGLVGITPQYGSEDFNDHHFHYGYFLYASAILARYDSSFVSSYGATVNLLAADIANADRSSKQFPYLRVVDTYEGHSWAGGLARFADGNNQESASEAVNAWYGLMLWGTESKNASLEQEGRLLYNQETRSELTYNFGSTAASSFPAGFAHRNVSLIWSAKEDWATWFSAAPEAKHGILYLPISGGSLYLNQGGNLAADRQALSSELGGKQPSGWQDILLLTQAEYDPAGAQKAFSGSTYAYDSSNSQSFTYIWLALAGQGRL